MKVNKATNETLVLMLSEMNKHKPDFDVLSTSTASSKRARGLLDLLSQYFDTMLSLNLGDSDVEKPHRKYVVPLLVIMGVAFP
jgi:hypothetical protein